MCLYENLLIIMVSLSPLEYYCGMHEMSIAMNIIELAADAARSEGGNTITGIELEIGTLSGIMTESLEFCFEAASNNTMAQGAQLKIHLIPGKGLCISCNNEIPVESIGAQCPHCGEYLLNILQGKELRLKAITIDE